MADPISILSLLEGSVGLILQCANVAKSLNDIAGRYKQAKLTILSLTQEVDTIELAWGRIRDWSQVQTVAGTDVRFCERLDRSLEYGRLVMAALEQDLNAFKTANATDILDFRRRSKVAFWSDQAFKDHQNRIRGQASAMSLLLQVLELPCKDRDEVMTAKEREFCKSDESAYSIVPSRMSSRMSVSTMKRDSHMNIESTELTYRRFSFENDLFTARVYKRNYRNALMYRGQNQPPEKMVETRARYASISVMLDRSTQAPNSRGLE